MPPTVNSRHSIAVFLGPSLSREEAGRLIDADFHPPARRGDIYRISATGVRSIVLVDGVFHSTPSIWPREILDAMGGGIRVFGAASMGALRAAELHRFGMIGHGTIFEWYRAGQIDGDDEVALWHGPEETGYCPLSEPLVNIRATLSQAADDGWVTLDQAGEIVAFAKQTHYPDRSYRHLLGCPPLREWPAAKLAAFDQYLQSHQIDLKRRDAIGVLRLCAACEEQNAPAVIRDPLAANSHVWQLDRMLLTGLVGSGGIQSGEDVLEAAEKDEQLVARLWSTLSIRGFLLDWARHNQILVPEQALRSSIARWEIDHGVTPGCDWLRSNGLTLDSARALLAEQFLVEWLASCGPAAFGLTSADQSATPEHTFLVDWARRNGVSCPADAARQVGAERTGPVAAPDAQGRSRSDRRPGDAAYASFTGQPLVPWMVEQGPHHFGIDWSFECALLGELQITGMAAELLMRV